VLFLALQEGIGEIWESSKYDDGIEVFIALYEQAEMAAMLANSGFTVQEQILNPGRWRNWLHFIATVAHC
jgi:hypothetical protein